MLSTALSLLAALLAILLVIVLHELGHFSVARACGIKIQRFSVGFGKVIWRRTDRRGTEYTLCILPLGGYVKMLGEGSESVGESDKAFAFNHKPLWMRALVVFAGPFVNFILAIFLFWVVFQLGITHIPPVIGEVIPHSIAADAGLKSGDEIKKMGQWPVYNWQSVAMHLMWNLGDENTLNVTVKAKQTKVLETRHLNLDSWSVDDENPQLFQSIGFLPFQPKIPPVILAIQSDSPAAHLLKPGDKIVGINHQAMDDWFKVAQFLQEHPDQKIELSIERDHQIQTMDVYLSHRNAMGYLGVQVQQPQWPKSYSQEEHYSWLGAMSRAAAQTVELIAFNGIVLLKMVTGKLSLHSLSGPIAIFQTAGSAFKVGLSAYLGFIAFISVSLGFINLLPIPCLDGGYLFFFLIEALCGRPIPERYQQILLRLGLLFLVLLMTQAVMNDLLRY